MSSGSPVQYAKPGGNTAVAMQWWGKFPDRDDDPHYFAGKVTDFRGWGIACHSQGLDTLATDDFGDVAKGEYIVKHYPMYSVIGVDLPDSITVENQSTIDTYFRSVTDPDGWFSEDDLAANGGVEEDDVVVRDEDV